MMVGLICFLSGLTVGGFVSCIILCCFQINRINDYESEIERLKKELAATY